MIYKNFKFFILICCALTVSNISVNAKSAKEDGTSFALPNMEKFMNMKVAVINFKTLGPISFHIPNY